ncbi:unnamed protein product [Enterobius vermicularis]|uniref:SET domain-containing protein n=1 Tax=Enterobius vermicularis TaxID=51028 RepID=A0A0N4VI64_ENTVE|nr:unnamed protein product [Enterobius vermicularis]
MVAISLIRRHRQLFEKTRDYATAYTDWKRFSAYPRVDMRMISCYAESAEKVKHQIKLLASSSGCLCAQKNLYPNGLPYDRSVYQHRVCLPCDNNRVIVSLSTASYGEDSAIVHESAGHSRTAGMPVPNWATKIQYHSFCAVLTTTDAHFVVALHTIPNLSIQLPKLSECVIGVILHPYLFKDNEVECCTTLTAKQMYQQYGDEEDVEDGDFVL